MPIELPQGELLYRFVVIADTHINEADDRASSFFELNRLANERAHTAFNAAAALKPSFVMHLGDIVHPLPCSKGFEAASANYRRLEAVFDCPVHLTPGNHDVGDKRWPLAPVAGIEPDFIRDYERVFGAQWLDWVHGPCHFFSLNTSLMNSGLPDEQVQREWFTRKLDESPADERKFLALHYPPYLRSATEAAHYDNVDEPARSWLLSILERHKFEAVFCGHVHNFWYDQHEDTEIYLLPSTAFVRQDYSDLQRVKPPGDEGGRQDVDKLGFFLVDVYERGHISRFMRCGQPQMRSANAQLHATSPHTKRPALPNLGIDLAYPWAEEIDLPPNSALDEFRRKRVRNDYPLLALFELGASLVRIPVEDLDAPELCSRLQKLGRTGMRAQVVVSTHDVSVSQFAQLRALGIILDSIEWVLHDDAMAAIAPRARRVMEALGEVPLLLSKLRRPSDSAVDGLKYGHLVFHGWVPQEAERIGSLLGSEFSQVNNAGAVIRVRLDESPLGLAHQAAELGGAFQAPFALVVRMGTDNPATEQASDMLLVERCVETAIAAWRYPTLRFVIDGLVDTDRGYFRRLGLIDRAFNPRLAGRVLRHLQSLLARMNPAAAEVRCIREEGGMRYDIQTADARLQVAAGGASISVAEPDSAQATLYSLVDGCVLDPNDQGASVLQEQQVTARLHVRSSMA